MQALVLMINSMCLHVFCDSAAFDSCSSIIELRGVLALLISICTRRYVCRSCVAESAVDIISFLDYYFRVEKAQCGKKRCVEGKRKPKNLKRCVTLKNLGTARVPAYGTLPYDPLLWRLCYRCFALSSWASVVSVTESPPFRFDFLVHVRAATFDVATMSVYTQWDGPTFYSTRCPLA